VANHDKGDSVVSHLSADSGASAPGVDDVDDAAARPQARTGQRRAARLVAVPALALIVYFVVRPWLASDAAGLAIAGAVPVCYTIAIMSIRRRVDLWATLTSVCFAISCIASLLSDGSSLPLKLHEAAVTFVLGVVLLCAAVARRPLPVGRVLKIAHSDRYLDSALSVMIGSFFVLHALLHLALALTLSTDSYLAIGRVVDLGTIGVGVACLYSFLRRFRRDPQGRAPLSTHQARDELGMR
jgi:intracellular septation protein A